MTAHRLPAPLHPGAVRGGPVTLVVDGHPVQGFAGEPVAAALLAAGRPILSRSFRFHRPRSLMCSTGQCGWCECRIDDRPSVRSCQVPAVDGLRVESEHAWPTASRDVFWLLDLGSRWIPPTFYHHRFLRPRRLRKRYLDLIRRFGGRGRIRPGTDRSARDVTRQVEMLRADVAVVGGGPAGLAAAEAAASAGASVVLLEADEAVGGPWRWREGPLPDGRSLDELTDALVGAGIRILTSATVAEIDDAGLHAITPTRVLDIEVHGVVVATGSHERLPTVPGNDRPGVMGARAVEWLIRRHGIVPGRRAVVVGSGPDVDRAATALRSAGATAMEVADPATLASIEGRRHVTGLHLRTAEGVDRVAADLLVIGAREPAAALARAATPRDSMVVVVAGAAAGRPIDDAAALELAASAGRAAAAGRGSGVESPPTPEDGAPAAVAAALRAAAMVCFCEDVRVGDVRREEAAGYAHPELLKRRTGALTGPCQGKYCEAALIAMLGDHPSAAPTSPMPTHRPPARPIRLGDLVASGPSSTSDSDT